MHMESRSSWVIFSEMEFLNGVFYVSFLQELWQKNIIKFYCKIFPKIKKMFLTV